MKDVNKFLFNKFRVSNKEFVLKKLRLWITWRRSLGWSKRNLHPRNRLPRNLASEIMARAFYFKNGANPPCTGGRKTAHKEAGNQKQWTVYGEFKGHEQIRMSEGR